MRYPIAIKDQIRELRRMGLSLDEIQTKVKLPRTTINNWINDIQLTKEQLSAFSLKRHNALQAGRINLQTLRKNKRLDLEKALREKALSEIGFLTQKELFIAGIALYWAGGFKNKHEGRLGFCNSDPIMIRFYLHWAQNLLHVDRDFLVARLTINAIYKNKTKEIEKYWSGVTGIPLSQFSKPFYQNTAWKKKFNSDNYKGVLRIHIKDSLEDLLKMRGWIEALSINLPG